MCYVFVKYFPNKCRSPTCRCTRVTTILRRWSTWEGDELGSNFI